MADRPDNSGLDRLEALVGDWKTETTHPVDPSIRVRGRAAFEWFDGGRFLVLRSTVEHPDFPNSISIVEPERMHYFDSRGVTRVYEMSLDERVWRLERDGEPFPQRFVGEFSGDGRTIDARWERVDHGEWIVDFPQTYTKLS